MLCLAAAPTACDKRSRAPTTSPTATTDGCPARSNHAATDYIPPNALGLVSIRVDEVVDFEREVVGDDMIEEAGYQEVLAAMAACGLDRESFRAVTLAAAEDEAIVIVDGKGLGEESRIRCMQGELGYASFLAPWQVERHGCEVRFESHGETLGFVASEDVIVFATPSWLASARSISLGAKPNPPRRLVKRGDAGKTMSFGGDLRPWRDDLGSLPLVGGLETITGTLDLATGFELDVEGTYASRSLADTTAHELEALRLRGKLLAPELGIPARLLDRISIRQRGQDVKIAVDLSRRDVQEITAALRAKLDA